MTNEVDQVAVETEVINDDAVVVIEQPQDEVINDEQDHPEVIKLRAKNRELLEESKANKAKLKEALAAIEANAATVQEADSAKAEIQQFKKSVVWSHFLDDLRIIPEYRDFVSQELAINGFVINSFVGSDELQVFLGNDPIDSKNHKINELKRKHGSMFMGSSASGGAGSASSPHRHLDPVSMREDAAANYERALKAADAAEQLLISKRKNPDQAPTGQSVNDAKNMRLGIK